MLVYEDTKSTINLSHAPTVTKNAKPLSPCHHYIRLLVQHTIANLVPTANVTADLLTTPMAPALFPRPRDQLLNLLPSAPSAHICTLAGGCQLQTSLSPIGAVGVIPSSTLLPQSHLRSPSGNPYGCFPRPVQPAVLRGFQPCHPVTHGRILQDPVDAVPSQFPPLPRRHLGLVSHRPPRIVQASTCFCPSGIKIPV
jgi:hypothetical protein